MARRSIPASSVASLAAVATALLVVLSAACTDAYAFGPAPSRRSVGYSRSSVRKAESGVRTHRADGSAVTLYLFPTPPSVSAANHRTPRSRRQKPLRKESQLPAMSASVLVESDTLPSFHTAHGLLSPEVVIRIADNAGDLELGCPLHKFLKTYRRKGPMACLPMLSDPSVLPELTRAMRDIA